MTDTKKVLISAAAGAAVGFVAGILLAPDKGTETRKKLAELPRKTSDYMKEVTQKGKDSMSQLREKVFGKKEVEDVEMNLS